MTNPDKVRVKRDGAVKLLSQEPRETTTSSTDQSSRHQRKKALI